jgi:antibiotic biosynthesis monooxygenase (ABM) superfamily enzyme
MTISIRTQRQCSKVLDLLPEANVLYEVVAAIAPERRADYLNWLAPHIEEMLGFDGFISAEMFINNENDCEITCHYRLRDMDAMNAYLAGPAQTMRADGIKNFGGQLSATRRILTTR